MKNLTIVVLFIFAALLFVYAWVQHYDRKELQASVNLAQHVAENQFKKSEELRRALLEAQAKIKELEARCQ